MVNQDTTKSKPMAYHISVNGGLKDTFYTKAEADKRLLILIEAFGNESVAVEEEEIPESFLVYIESDVA